MSGQANETVVYVDNTNIAYGTVDDFEVDLGLLTGVHHVSIDRVAVQGALPYVNSSCNQLSFQLYRDVSSQTMFGSHQFLTATLVIPLLSNTVSDVGKDSKSVLKYLDTCFQLAYDGVTLHADQIDPATNTPYDFFENGGAPLPSGATGGYATLYYEVAMYPTPNPEDAQLGRLVFREVYVGQAPATFTEEFSHRLPPESDMSVVQQNTLVRLGYQ